MFTFLSGLKRRGKCLHNVFLDFHFVLVVENCEMSNFSVAGGLHFKYGYKLMTLVYCLMITIAPPPRRTY